jgi:methionyl-tRNA formyltransferase
MLERIVLLADPTEQGFLASILNTDNPHLDITLVSTLAELRAIDPSEFRCARLIAFVTAVIVPNEILRALGHGAYNFHPGPPGYPGWAPAHFALYERAKVFGVTFHAMADRVDSGPILDMDLFPISPSATVVSLETTAYAQIAMMFHRWAGALTHQAAPLQPRFPAQWGTRKNSRHRYRAMCSIPTDISKDDLAHRMSIFGHGHFGILPSVSLHGFEFRVSPGDATHESPSPGH